MQPSSQPHPNTVCSAGKRPSRGRDRKCDSPKSDSNSAIPDMTTKLVEAGDVLGLLAWFRSRSVLRLPPTALDDLSAAIRNLERKDVNALIDAAYVEVIGLTTVLLLRYQVHVERRLSESDAGGGNSGHLPCDLIDEDWIGRIERTTKFLMELTTTRERVCHVARLNADAKRKEQCQSNGIPMGTNPYQARNGKDSSHQSRFSAEEERIQFP